MRAGIFVLWCLVAAAVLLELGIRWLVPLRPPPIMPSGNARLVYELDPEHPEINAFGMRGAEIAREGLRDGYVIAAIGDSHTYSVRSVDAGESYPAQLERALRERGHGGVSVLNLGVPGYNAAQELEVLRARTCEFEPDLVILQVTGNDTRVPNYVQPRHPGLNRLVHRSRLLVSVWKALLYRPGFVQSGLYQFVGRHLPDALLYEEGLVGTVMDPELVHPTDDPRFVPEPYHYMLGRENLEAHVRAFGRIAGERGVSLLATGFIAPEDEELYREAGFEVLPFSTLFRDEDMEDYGYRPGHSADHFDERGSGVIARGLAAYIEARFLPASPAAGAEG